MFLASVLVQVSAVFAFSSGCWQDKYIEREEIAKGNYGTIFKWQEIATGKLFACKENNSQTNTIQREFEIMKELKTKYVLKPICAENEYFLLPFLSQGTLRQARTFSEERKRILAAHILTAVREIHSEGIFIADLKTDNILLDGNSIKFIDFGLARRKDENIFHSGSKRYMAPEMHDCLFNESCTASFHSDWFSAGVVIWEMYVDLEDVPGEDWSPLGPPYNAYASTELKDLVKMLVKLPRNFDHSFDELKKLNYFKDTLAVLENRRVRFIG